MKNETTEQYKARILGYLEDREPLKVLAATPKRIEKLIAGVSPARLKRSPGAGRWSVATILAHLADTEVVIGYRYRSVAGRPGVDIAAYDQNQWAARMEYAARPVKASVASFAGVRQANVAMLKALKPRQWRDFGIHSERGRESIFDIARMAAGHDLNHLLQIEALLAG